MHPTRQTATARGTIKDLSTGWAVVANDANRATFTSSTNAVSFSGSEVKGSILLVPALSDASESMSTKPIPQSFSYSVPSSTSLVLNGVTYQASYGNIMNSLANYVTFVAHDTSKTECSCRMMAR